MKEEEGEKECLSKEEKNEMAEEVRRLKREK
jgi:hypothetical protein